MTRAISNKYNRSTNNNNARLPCNRVFTLLELQNHVCFYLGDKDIKRCSLVCRDWNSLFASNRWRKIVLWKNHPKEPTLRHHGTHIRHLYLLHINTPILKSITLSCPNIHTLFLLLDHTSMWVSYSALERLLGHLRETLRVVRVRYDGAYFQASLLWSLCWVKGLKEVQLDPYDSRGKEREGGGEARRLVEEEEYVGLLRCCPTLEGMVFPESQQPGFMGPNPGGSKAGGVQRWVKRVVVRVPVTVQEAIARRAKRVGIDGEQQRDIASTNADSSLLVSNENGTDSQVSSNRVRRILFKSCLLSISIFHRLVKECHNLDEIVFGGRSFTLLPDTWIVLSAQCPGLRIIRIQECDNLEPLPGVSTFIGMFLQLEELELNTVMFEKDPDDLHDGLDVVLKEHEVKVGVRHPLKVLCLSGFLRRPIYALADLLALPSTLSNIESLTVGRIDVPNYIGETESASELLSTSAQARYAFKDCSRWGLFSRLVVLDISLVDVPDKEVLRRLFDCFRDPNCWLLKLSVNVCHIQDLIDNSVCRAFRLKHNDPEQREIKHRRKVWGDMALRFCGLWFATVEKLTIRPRFQCYSPVETPGMDLFEARLVMAASPVARWCCVKGVMSSWDVKVLRRELMASRGGGGEGRYCVLEGDEEDPVGRCC